MTNFGILYVYIENMDDVYKIRQQKYLVQHWWPKFVDKWNNEKFRQNMCYMKKINEILYSVENDQDIEGVYKKRVKLYMTHPPKNKVNEYVDMYMDEYVDDIELQIAMMESMKLDVDVDVDMDVDVEPITACIDLRIYGQFPDQPIIINSVTYYLDIDQQEQVKKCWNMVNPQNSTGVIFKNNVEYNIGLYHDTQKNVV